MCRLLGRLGCLLRLRLGAWAVVLRECVGVLFEGEGYVCAAAVLCEELLHGSLKRLRIVVHKGARVFNGGVFLRGEKLVDFGGFAVGDGVAEDGVVHGGFFVWFQAAFCGVSRT